MAKLLKLTSVAFTGMTACQTYALAITTVIAACALIADTGHASDSGKEDIRALYVGNLLGPLRDEVGKTQARIGYIEKQLHEIESKLSAAQNKAQTNGVEIEDLKKKIPDPTKNKDTTWNDPAMLVRALGAGLQGISVITAGVFAMLAMWYTMHLKIGDMTLHCFATYREFDGDKAPKEEKDYHWWGHQHLQFTFWRRGLISNSTFHSWMLRRRLEDWCARKNDEKDGLHSWEKEKHGFQMTDFGKFMQEILVQEADCKKESLRLQAESENVRIVMEAHRLPLQKWLSCIQIVGKEMTLPSHARNLEARVVNKRLSLTKIPAQ